MRTKKRSRNQWQTDILARHQKRNPQNLLVLAEFVLQNEALRMQHCAERLSAVDRIAERR